MSSASLPAATYQTGNNVVGSRALNEAVLTDFACRIDGTPFTDPTQQIEAIVQVSVGGVWQHCVSSVQNGSATGTWATKNGTTNYCINMEVTYPGGITIDGIRMGIRVVNGPVNLGEIDFQWN